MVVRSAFPLSSSKTAFLLSSTTPHAKFARALMRHISGGQFCTSILFRPLHSAIHRTASLCSLHRQNASPFRTVCTEHCLSHGKMEFPVHVIALYRVQKPAPKQGVRCMSSGVGSTPYSPQHGHIHTSPSRLWSGQLCHVLRCVQTCTVSFRFVGLLKYPHTHSPSVGALPEESQRKEHEGEHKCETVLRLRAAGRSRCPWNITLYYNTTAW